MRRQFLVAAAAVVVAFGSVACSSDSDQQVFTSTLAGSNEVPANGTAAEGAAGFSLDGNVLSYTLEVSNINNITASHIHSGAAGVNGPVRVFLFRGNPTTSVTGGRTILISGTLTPADVTGISWDTLIAEMRAGTAYVNVHTTLLPAGEIRGQVQLVPDSD
jgi:hypothetical protein